MLSGDQILKLKPTKNHEKTGKIMVEKISKPCIRKSYPIPFVSSFYLFDGLKIFRLVNQKMEIKIKW